MSMDCEFIFKPIDKWPQKKTTDPKCSAFKSSYGDTLELLDKELRMLGVRRCVIQVDVEDKHIRRDNLLRSGARPSYQGVMLNFESKYGPLRYATDVFRDWKDNLRAIALGLEALRKVDRYGITKKGEQYTGWKQLPESIDGFDDISDAAFFLAEHSEVTAIDILECSDRRKTAYRQAALKFHPDKGGNARDFQKLQKAMERFNN